MAKNEWKRIVKELKKIEIVGNLDYVNLACYCNAYANYVETTKQLKDQPYCVERETRIDSDKLCCRDAKVRKPLRDDNRFQVKGSSTQG